MKSALNDFVSQIINLSATPTATGLSYGGLLGASNPRQQALEDLKRTTLKFASEYRNATRDKTKTQELTKEIEGHLRALNSLSVIDDNAFDKLLSELDILG
jgi:hypothetical protein